MNTSPIELSESQRIGTVDFVSPSEIKVALDLEAPENTALNAGIPTAFPRVNSYLIIANESGYIVGQVEWLAVERAPFPKRKGLQDFGLIDLPFPQRKLCLNPIGTLSVVSDYPKQTKYELKRGVYSFPSIGTPVLLPTELQLKSIIESGEGRRVLIGHAPLAGNAEVMVDPDKLFGRHLAVLGNTGSGKSCTVAGLIKWSLDEARKDRATQNIPNARFIILDPNGEYSKPFNDGKIFKVQDGDAVTQLKVPLWLWNSDEWCTFMQASERSQRPLLRRALREMKCGTKYSPEDKIGVEQEQRLRSYLSAQLLMIRGDRINNFLKSDESKFGYRIKSVKEELEHRAQQSSKVSSDIGKIAKKLEDCLAAAFKSFDKNGERVEYYRAFNVDVIEEIENDIEEILKKIGGVMYQEGPSENTPIPFDGDAFADHLDFLAVEQNLSQFIDPLIIRIRSMLADVQMRRVVGNTNNPSLVEWLESFLSSTPNSHDNPITVVDLSLVPSEIIHVVTAVISRTILEALQRYRLKYKKVLPTVIVMEEAHTFIKRYTSHEEEGASSTVCCRVFEKIAREGRKFGLGLVLSSQRPSELSPTVLSQCNSFILHRINNDKDQDAVSRLLPDHLRSMLRELPVLPSQHAFLLGWASELPVLTKMLDLPKVNRPESDDPDFWDVWTGKSERNVDWRAIAEEWQGTSTTVEADVDETPTSQQTSAEFGDFDDSDSFADE